MRQLRLVYRSEDGSLVVETTDDGEQFALPVDAVLRTAVRADLPRPASADDAAPDPADVAATAPRPTPATATGDAPIGPREIQVRVRAGESPDDLATAYGMTLERVMRFAGAVVGERRRIADEARRARARRSTSDGVVVVFGEAVDERFAAHGLAPDTVKWDARRREDGEWIVCAQWQGGGFTDGPHAAEWVFTRSSRFVTPLDDTAADLLSDRPIRPLVAPEPQRPNLSSAPPLVPGVVSFPPMPDAHTGPVPVVEEVFDQEAPAEGPRALPSALPAATVDLEIQVDAHPTTPAPTLDFDDAPPLPLGVWEPVGARAAVRQLGRRAESDDEKAARARVPSWDDILLGVRRKSD